MNKPLSYSGYKKYHDCPRLYKYHYIDKETPGQETSALCVGDIVDTAIMSVLNDEAYDLNALYNKHENKELYFYKDDLDLDIIDIDKISKLAKTLGWSGDNITDALKTFIKEQDILSPGQHQVLRAACWDALKIKIEAMITSFNKWILPQLAEIHDIQLHLDDGETHGYLDFTATTKDGKKVLFDLKTSGRPYERDSVLKSPQLSLYAAMHDYEYAGFIVLCKNLNKNKVKTCPACKHQQTGGNHIKCPKCKTTMDVVMEPTSFSQLIIDKVPDWNKSLTKEAMRETIKSIAGGHFPRNLNTCFWMYGRTCPYVSKCWKNK